MASHCRFLAIYGRGILLQTDSMGWFTMLSDDATVFRITARGGERLRTLIAAAA